jgi:hypothetical protein
MILRTRTLSNLSQCHPSRTGTRWYAASAGGSLAEQVQSPSPCVKIRERDRLVIFPADISVA